MRARPCGVLRPTDRIEDLVVDAALCGEEVVGRERHAAARWSSDGVVVNACMVDTERGRLSAG